MLDETRRFPCPSCKQIITDHSGQCKYCGAPVDPAVALALADVQDKVNQACSDASYLRTAAVAMFVFLGLSFIPFLPLVYYGFLFTFIAVVVMLVRWQLRYGNVNTADPDYPVAKRNKNFALVLWLVALPAGFVIRPLAGTLLAKLFE